MLRTDYDKLKEIVTHIDSLYEALEGVDNITNLKEVIFKGEKYSDKQAITFGGEIGEEMHQLVRGKIRELIRNSEEKFKLQSVGYPSIIKSIQNNHFKAMKVKKWDKTYWFFDLHGTVLKPTYNSDGIAKEYYPVAKEVLKVLSSLPEVVMIMYTCSHPHEIVKYSEFFEKDAIYFDYINENPEVKDNGYGHYDNKPYMNVLFEDKAGFDPEEDWMHVKNYLILKKLWP